MFLVDLNGGTSLSPLSNATLSLTILYNIPSLASFLLSWSDFHSSVANMLSTLERLPKRIAKYLGCQITSDLRWSDHVNNICGKANRTLGFLRRNLNVGSTSVKENAYKTLVRPTLEYASTVWDPYHQVVGIPMFYSPFHRCCWRGHSNAGQM
jgi:hypothetical protein